MVRRVEFIYLICLFTIPLSGICIDLYTPSLPAMTDYFHTQKTYVQMTISAFLIGFSIFQLIAGPLVDALGRRMPLFLALFSNAAIALAIPHASDIYIVIVIRIIQGASVAISSVAARSIIIDLYSHNKELFLKKISLGNVIWGLGPIIAPAIGGFIQHYFNWQTNFNLMGLYILLLGTIAIWRLEETQTNFQSFQLKNIVKNYITIIRNTKFLAYSLSCGPTWASLVLFAIIGPYLIQSELNYSPVVFGNIALFAGLAWLLGSLFCRSIINSVNDKVFNIAFIIGALISSFMIITGYLGYLSIWLVGIPVVLFSIVSSFIFTNHFSNALAIFPKEIGGSVSALSSSITSIMLSLLTAIGSLLTATTQVPLGFMYLCIIGFVFSMHYSFLQNNSS